LSKVDEGLE